MPNYKTTEIFTPTTPARLTFVERETINDQLVDNIRLPGKQIIVYGHSGSGKTTLLVNKLDQIYEDYVITRCTKETTFDQLLLSAFDQLSPFYTQSKGVSEKSILKSGLSTNYLGIKAQLGSSTTRSSSTNVERVLPPQLTPQNLAEFLGVANCCWVLEDFHKAPIEVRQSLAQNMKVFMDSADNYPSVKIIALGAVDSAHLVIESDQEMKNRVSEIEVPLMSNPEINRIIQRGTELLNIKFDNDVVEGIVWFANGMASVAHELCLHVCNVIGVYETQSTLLTADSAALQEAVNRYIADSSDTLKFSFEKAFRRTKKTKFDNYTIVVKALAKFSQDGATKPELLGEIKKEHFDYPATNLSHCITQLLSFERGSLIRHSKSSGKYSFAEPIFRAFALTMFGKEEIAPATRKTISIRLSPASLRKLLGDDPNQLELELNVLTK